jgi:peptidoglycan/xylan/chitin deacetylase (PgdA/CDA1 family)
MGLLHACVRITGHLALATAALGLGVAASRYTDLARVDQTHAALASMGPPKARPLSRSIAAALVSAAHSATREEDAPVQLHALPASEPTFDGLAEALRDGRIMRGVTPHRLILFTFDDGPDRNTTPKLLDRLDAAGVKAVFFLTGDNLRGENVAERKNQEIARETVRRGHIVASHGMHHRQLPLLSDFEALLEVGQTEAVFRRVLGARPWLIRPPGGARSTRIDRLLADRGYTTMLWNLGAGDFQVRTAADVHKTWQAVFDRRRAQGEEGGIVLLHDTYAWSVDAFQLIVQDLQNRNCQLLAKGEELYDFVDDPGLFFEARGKAGPSADAAPVVLSPEALEARQAPLREMTEQRCQALATRD